MKMCSIFAVFDIRDNIMNCVLDVATGFEQMKITICLKLEYEV